MLDKILMRKEGEREGHGAKNGNILGFHETSSKVRLEGCLNVAQSLYDQGRFEEAIAKSR